MSYKKKTFWSDEAHIHFHRNKGKVIGGYYFRAFELVKFMKLVEEENDGIAKWRDSQVNDCGHYDRIRDLENKLDRIKTFLRHEL